MFFRSFEEMMKNIGEEVIKLTNSALKKHEKKELSESQEKLIKSLIVDLSSKNLHDNSVYKLLCNLPKLLFILYYVFPFQIYLFPLFSPPKKSHKIH